MLEICKAQLKGYMQKIFSKMSEDCDETRAHGRKTKYKAWIVNDLYEVVERQASLLDTEVVDTDSDVASRTQPQKKAVAKAEQKKTAQVMKASRASKDQGFTVRQEPSTMKSTKSL